MEENNLKYLRAEEITSYDFALFKEQDKWTKYSCFVANAVSVMPWLGQVLANTATSYDENEQGKAQGLFEEWNKVHKEKLDRLLTALDDMANRLDSVYDRYQNRIESDEYLGLVRCAFKSWDTSESIEKQQYVINLISNAVASHLCPDDQVRLFNDWLDKFHEIHFKVVQAIYQGNGITRLRIWLQISDVLPKEGTAEADLFKLVIDDLTTSGVIKQYHPTTYDSRIVRQANDGKAGESESSENASEESVFENTKPYQLTELGSQFVYYTMNQVVKKKDGN